MDPQTAEAGEAYLNSMGFRSLIEWMTAEALLSRPDDPLTFLQNLLQEKIGEVSVRMWWRGRRSIRLITVGLSTVDIEEKRGEVPARTHAGLHQAVLRCGKVRRI
jgi:hypothetical protein